jgi:hypothetical protein
MPLVRLCVTDHPAALWKEVAGPWLRTHGTAWREIRAVLTPNAAWAAALKGQVVASGLSAMGVAWLTPGRWRALALKQSPGPPLRIALREDLHLLLETAAAQLPENPLARAYGTDPAPFQSLLDALDGAGWNSEVFADPAAQALAVGAAALRQQAGWVTTAEADRLLREAIIRGSMPPIGGRLLIAGFGPGDWALRPLLEAACGAYAEVEMVFDVTDANEASAAAWVDTWEETGIAAEWLEPDAATAPYAPLAVAFAEKEKTAPLEKTHHAKPQLWLAEDLQTEADLVVAQALSFLSEAKETASIRVGIVVGQINSPLAREVAARLVARDLPHHDALGHQPGRSAAQTMFEAWLDWQEGGRMADLLAWARIAHRHRQLSDTDMETAERDWRDAAAVTLNDDPAVLAGWLTEESAAAKFFAAWPRLSEKTPWDAWIKIIASVTEKLRWPDPPEPLVERLEGWSSMVNTPPRAALLRWVRAVSRLPGRTRAALGREPFAPLQIVDAASAAAQPWTHLILCGLQHGEWPADDEDAPLLNEAKLTELNRQILRQGSQGEGHTVVAPGFGLLPPAAERHRLARASFARLLSLPSVGLALTTRRADPADGRPARWSEYFWSVAAQVFGRLPTDADSEAMMQQSSRWLAQFHSTASEQKEMAASEMEITTPARAFAARRDVTQAFDAFSFCLAQPPSSPLQLSCKAWEAAVTRPGAAWFKHLLRVEPRWDPATDDALARSLGVWAHGFVRPLPETNAAENALSSLPMPTAALWHELAADRAEAARLRVTAAFSATGKNLPEAWIDAWITARRVAEYWVDALSDRDGWPQALAEANLPRGLSGNLPGMEGILPLRGRLDLVLLSQSAQFVPGGLAGARAWLIDFKTGGDEVLGLKRLSRGEGLQLALYALALRALGASEVALTTLTREAAAEPQLTNADLEHVSLHGLWRLLAAFAITGRWGEFRDLNNEHDRPGDYPLATLPVPAEILREKWALTHPYLLR